MISNYSTIASAHGEEDSGNETGAVVAQTGRQEQGSRVIDDTVDSAQLLHDLDSARDQESLSVLQVVVLEQSLPAASTDSLFQFDGTHDLLVLLSNGNVRNVPAHEPRDRSQGFFLLAVSGQPSRGFRDDQGEESDGNNESALERDRNPPGDRARDVRESEADPVGQEDTKVEARELGGEEPASSSGGCRFGQDDGAGRVDEAHSESRDDTSSDHGTGARDTGLDTGSCQHEDGTDPDTLASSESFSDDGRGDSTDAASDFVLRMVVTIRSESSPLHT